MDRYILVKKSPVKEPDLYVWGRWMEIENRVVAKDSVGGVEVSTVFLGIDHNFGGGKPILFETLVFGGKLDQEMLRYSTWEDALYGHLQVLEEVKITQETQPKQASE